MSVPVTAVVPAPYFPPPPSFPAWLETYHVTVPGDMVVFAYEFNLHHLWTCLREHCLCYPLEDPLVDELELALTLSTQITLAESRKNVQDFLRSVLRGQTTFNERAAAVNHGQPLAWVIALIIWEEGPRELLHHLVPREPQLTPELERMIDATLQMLVHVEPRDADQNSLRLADALEDPLVPLENLPVERKPSLTPVKQEPLVEQESLIEQGPPVMQDIVVKQEAMVEQETPVKTLVRQETLVKQETADEFMAEVAASCPQ